MRPAAFVTLGMLVIVTLLTACSSNAKPVQSYTPTVEQTLPTQLYAPNGESTPTSVYNTPQSTSASPNEQLQALLNQHNLLNQMCQAITEEIHTQEFPDIWNSDGLPHALALQYKQIDPTSDLEFNLKKECPPYAELKSKNDG